MGLINFKGLLASKTIWGIFAVLVPSLTQLYDFLLALPVGTLSPKVQTALTTLGALLALYGRVTATKQIDGIV